MIKFWKKPIFYMVILNIFFWIYSFLIYQKATDIVPLHYNIYFGIDLYSKKIFLFTPAFVGLLILIINIYTMEKVKEKIFRYFLEYSIIFFNIILLLSLYLINSNFIL